MNELVKTLSENEHPVEVSLRPAKTLDAFKAAVERGYVHVKFTQTRGGTELGVRLNRDLSDLKAIDAADDRGRVKLCGDLVLDYEKVRCVAEIDLQTLNGNGRLELLA